MRTLKLVGLALLAAGCHPSDSDDYHYCCTAPRSAGAFFEITVHNFDPVLYQIRLEWIEPDGRLQNVLIDVVDADQSSTVWHDAILGAPYWLVLADFQGAALDSVFIGSVNSPSEGPVIVTYLIAGSRFVP